MKLNEFVTAKAMKYFNLEVPEGTAIPLSEDDLSSYKLPKRDNQKENICLAALITYFLTGKLKPYPHNRGTGDVSITQKYVRKGIDLTIIGDMHVGMYSDPIYYGYSKPELHQCSFHSRLYGALQRHLDGTMTKAEYLYEFPITFTDDSNLDWTYHSVHEVEFNGKNKTMHLWQRVDRYGEIVYRLTPQPENGLDYVKPIGNGCYSKEGLLRIGIKVDNQLCLHNL